MPAQRRQLAITASQRRALRQYSRAHPLLTQKQLQTWFENEFQRLLTQPSISESLSSKYSHLDEPIQLPDTAQRLRPPKWPKLEEALFKWYQEVEDKTVITGELIKTQALRFWQRLPLYQGIEAPVFSNGWLQGFKNRHNIKLRTRYGEAAAIDQQAVEEQLVAAKAVVSQFQPSGWNDTSDQVCVARQARERPCVPQLYTQRAARGSKASSKDRIARLEQQIASIAASVQHRTPGAESRTPREQYASSQTSSAEEDNPAGHLPGPTPLTHLKLLFDNTSMEPAQKGSNNRMRHSQRWKRHLDHARAKLQRLLPSREELAACSNYAAPWMSLYYAIFPFTSSAPSREDMVSSQDEIEKADAEPVAIAQFLLSFAITLLQVPKAENVILSKNWLNTETWVTAIIRTVHDTIVQHTTIAATVEGIAVTILYLRLQLGRGNVKELWLSLRRVIALAELIGLPRAWHNNQPTNNKHHSHPRRQALDRVALWEAICATDRLASMMFNLPAATSSYNFPTKETISPENHQVLIQPYIFELASIAMRVQLLDEGSLINQDPTEVYEKVLTADRHLRDLKLRTNPAWWGEETRSHLSGDVLVQFWHYYLLARLHLHAAMANDTHDHYSYSRITCTEACHAVARRYTFVRKALPTGFFLCRVVDMQVFTAATYLLLSTYHSQAGPSTTMLDAAGSEGPRLEHVRQIVETMEFVSGRDRSGSEFAVEAAAALKALMGHLERPDTAAPEGLTLRIPLLGQVRIRWKGRSSAEREVQMADIGGGSSRQRRPQQSSDLETPSRSLAEQFIPQRFNQDFIPDSSSTQMPWMMEFDLNPTMQDAFFADYGNNADFQWWDGEDPMGFL